MRATPTSLWFVRARGNPIGNSDLRRIPRGVACVAWRAPPQCGSWVLTGLVWPVLVRTERQAKVHKMERARLRYRQRQEQQMKDGVKKAAS